MRSYFALSALASVALAQNQTIPFFFPGADDSNFVASVVSANPSTTALSITCPTGTDASDCGLGPGLAYSIISTTIYVASLSVQDEVTMSLSCNENTASSLMTCDISVGGSAANDPGETKAVLSGTDVSFLTATVTAGQQELSVPASVASSSLQTSVSAGASATKSGVKATGTSVTSNASGSAAAASATGAAFRFGIEGNALLALAGAAAFNIL